VLYAKIMFHFLYYMEWHIMLGMHEIPCLCLKPLQFKRTPSKTITIQTNPFEEYITFLSPLQGLPSSTMASRVTPHSYFLL
jgi:hypothetical protein